MDTLASRDIQSWLVWFLRGLLILGFLVLVGRLIDLQVIKGSYYHTLAEDNRIREVPIEAARGLIKARGGEILVSNREVKKTVEFKTNGEYEKKVATTDSDPNQIISEFVRDYTVGSDFAHVAGYLGEVAVDELGRIKGECPDKGPRKLGELVGRGGLEETYDCTLTGIAGEELIEVDSSGRKIRTLGRKNPIAGKDITTSIDYSLQRYVATQLEGKRGAIVVSDGKGQVLALYSSPSYDPNLFVGKMDKDKINAIFNDKDLPLFNRAIGGLFHPGSVFKPIVAIAALQEGFIDKDYRYTDTGAITIKSIYGTFSYKNWYFTQYGGTEGEIDLTRAITRSTDTFFYKVGELTGIDALDYWADKFNLNKKTGIDLPGEVAGLVPSPTWKIKEKGERWFLGNTYHFSIGQGDLVVTPLGINAATSAIANNGKYCVPHVIGKESTSGEQQVPFREFRCNNLGVDQKNIDLVKEGMKGVCSAGGTGYTFFNFKDKSGIEVACKTGTAEDEKGDPHAWFSAFAPADDPDIVVTVLVEHGGEGSSVAGPIARSIFDFWYKLPSVTPQPSSSLTPSANE